MKEKKMMLDEMLDGAVEALTTWSCKRSVLCARRIPRSGGKLVAAGRKPEGRFCASLFMDIQGKTRCSTWASKKSNTTVFVREQIPQPTTTKQ